MRKEVLAALDRMTDAVAKYHPKRQLKARRGTSSPKKGKTK